MANGKSMADVAQILGISERTVREHVDHAKVALNATTPTHAVAKAIKSRQIIL
ncbi:Transcriptional activator protein LuxR [compost metagenome]